MQYQNQKGQTLLLVMLLGFIALIVVLGVVLQVTRTSRDVNVQEEQQEAFSTAEAAAEKALQEAVTTDDIDSLPDTITVETPDGDVELSIINTPRVTVDNVKLTTGEAMNVSLEANTDSNDPSLVSRVGKRGGTVAGENIGLFEVTIRKGTLEFSVITRNTDGSDENYVVRRCIAGAPILPADAVYGGDLPAGTCAGIGGTSISYLNEITTNSRDVMLRLKSVGLDEAEYDVTNSPVVVAYDLEASGAYQLTGASIKAQYTATPQAANLFDYVLFNGALVLDKSLSDPTQ